MDCKDKIRELRESTGMNRKEFCKYFEIPYRTVTEWELGGRHAPEYVLRLLEYYIRAEKLEQSSKTAQDIARYKSDNLNHVLNVSGIEAE
jgi:transcriptional regulator with XRE-family HTH domain